MVYILKMTPHAHHPIQSIYFPKLNIKLFLKMFLFKKDSD